MTKTKLILCLAFILVFAAGAVIGTVTRVARPPRGGHAEEMLPPGGRQPGGDRGPRLGELLKLTPEQQEQMKAIWSEHMNAREADREKIDRRRHELQQQRDEQVQALLTEPQRARYEAILKEYSDHVAELNQQRLSGFRQAVEKTKAILTPEQAAQYEEFLATHRPPEGERRRPPSGPSTRRWE